MDITIQHVSVEDKPILRNLMELYLCELSSYEERDVNEDGSFGYKYLDNYWTETNRHAFLIRVAGKLAGFVLVRQIDAHTHELAEFFVLPRYRRQQVGRTVACRIFGMFPGRWRVMQLVANEPAQQFWRAVIGEYTGGQFSEVPAGGEWEHPGQIFVTPGWKEAADAGDELRPRSGKV
ncbi:MAG: GNAT family N-acetyltransferase [Armatimonadota bacterium]